MDKPFAKRAGPAEVPAVVIDGVRFEAIPWGKARGLGQNGGYIAAYDAATGKELWLLKVYAVDYEPKLEGDVQDVFITSLSKTFFGGKLKVADEKGRTYLVDPKTRTVRQK